MIILLVTMLTFFVIYAPQPLLPLLAQTFDISRTEAALLITAVMVPLSLAPVTYGYVLGTMPAMRLLKRSVLGLALSTIAIGLANAFGWLLVLRVAQGILLPAILTSLMTYLSVQGHGQDMQRLMSGYIAATILGGYLGRLLSGFSATFFDWHIFFLVLGFALLLAMLPLGRHPADARISGVRPTPREILGALNTGPFLRVYTIIFCMFFVFAAMMNFLPFRLAELLGEPSELLTGLMYTGYLVGIATSLGSGWIIKQLGGEQRTLQAGIAIYLGVVLLAAFAGGWGLFGLLFVFCGAMFLVHATAAGWLNRLAGGNQGIINGVYISAYYSGGVLGSYLPGLVYEHYSWQAFVGVLAIVVVLALVIVLPKQISVG